ncbi:MAG: SLC13 family permease [Ignavibacteria bacterium]|nr:SLC13 family permease [Ignavibacteria bacterium]
MEQIIVFSTLIVALVLFIWGKIRHDITSVICLLILVIAGIIPSDEAFSGFAHPAVITVAMILIVSRGLQNSGLIDVIGHWILKAGNTLTLQIGVLSVIVCFVSAFMNNVGALAVLMPVAIHAANKSNHSPSLVLMPLAFASLLGGMITLIGTPPNIIIASFRTETAGVPFEMFDFAPVGAGLSVVGLLFIVFIGWRLLPKRENQKTGKERFNIEDYITEVCITGDSQIKGSVIHDVKKYTDSDIQILNIIRDNQLIHAPAGNMVLEKNDILTIEADSNALKKFIEKSKTKMFGKNEKHDGAAGADNISIAEAVVTPGAPIIDRSAAALQLRTNYGLNLLAVSRKTQKIKRRLNNIRFRPGDVLLVQGETKSMDNTLNELGCLPLADRGYSIGKPKRIVLALAIFGIAIALILSGIVKVQIAFTIAALFMVLTKIIPLREIYTSIDWPVIVLLGAMLPVGAALETSGGAKMIADKILVAGESLPLWLTLSVILAVTMLLSGLINNAATVVLMAPIGISIANELGLSADSFLMTIAVGASAAFLTPIGHQSNTLVMGPGGYSFSDYIRMGLPISIIIILVTIPLIFYFWM